MKKIIFFMLTLLIILPTSTFSLELLKSNRNRGRVIYQAPMLNTRNFEDFIVFISRKNRNVYKFKQRIARIIFVHSYKYNIDPLTLLSLLGHESKYKWWKKGKVGELGMGQIRPSIWLKTLQKAGIIHHKKPHQLKFIGKGIESTAFILNIYRDLCLKWKRQKKLRWRGYRDVNECMIRRYNGSLKKDTQKYYTKVTSNIGRYYFFIRRGGIVTNINNNEILTARR